jgi:hydrogenase expression/formation protein HypC
MSRLHRVVGVGGSRTTGAAGTTGAGGAARAAGTGGAGTTGARAATGYVDVEDVDGAVHRVSLLALDGPVPEPGEWLVVHSGYAIDRVDADQAAAAVEEIRRAPAGPAGSRGE